MKFATHLTLGFAATALAAAASAANADPTADRPFMEEVVVTAPAPAATVMEEIVVTAPRPVWLLALETSLDAHARTEQERAQTRAPDAEEAKTAATRAALGAWLAEQAPVAPRLSF